MKTKKSILKEVCMGKGGPLKDVVKAGISGVKDTFKKNLAYDKSLMGGNDPVSYASAALKAPIGGAWSALKKAKEIVSPKKEILKNTIKKITPGNFPTTSKKNSMGEIINPTPKDVSDFNSKFKTIRKTLKPEFKQKTEVKPSWMEPDYKPGSIMRGYTKYTKGKDVSEKV